MDEQRDSRIEGILAGLNEGPAGVDVKDMYQLEKLGNTVSSKAASIKHLRNGPCSPGISVGDAAKASGTSQATFHNKPALVRHLETRKEQLDIGDKGGALVTVIARTERTEHKVNLTAGHDSDLVLAASEQRQPEMLIKSLKSAPEEVKDGRESYTSG